jgi:hypothetical protein
LPHDYATQSTLVDQLKELQKAFDQIIKNEFRKYQGERKTHPWHHNKGLNESQLIHLSLLKDKAAVIGKKLVVEHDMPAKDVIDYAQKLFNFNRTSYRFFVKKQTKTESNLFKAEVKKNKKTGFCCFPC